MTCVHFPDVRGDIAINDKAVVDEEFVAGPDGGDCMNKNPITGFDCFAVRCTCMVQEARAVAAAAAINHTTVGETENIGVPVPGPLTGGGAAPAGHFALVLDEPLARGDGLQRKQSCAMDRGASCRDAAQSHGAIFPSETHSGSCCCVWVEAYCGSRPHSMRAAAWHTNNKKRQFLLPRLRPNSAPGATGRRFRSALMWQGEPDPDLA
ncbi:hypothetical protein LMG28688_06138 [Paraburkholderia caffeinitolerans]|uniref:Uncharacterized protein n=1 Tax=Paraburkholderia caffeinitolerans TaxID=1723730 RepID=A0A6J5GSE6_9BURK|nr:hypothetical protein LMG28688_06138 [Paraburkholderia caffeinitolerans]